METRFHKIEEKATKYFENHGIPADNIKFLETAGATQCIYATLRHQEQNLFVKSGEKVNREVDNLKWLWEQKHNSNISTLHKLSSSAESILVTTFLDQPNFGLEQVEKLYSDQISPEDFILFQSSVFQALAGLPVSQNTDRLKSEFFAKRLSTRFNKLEPNLQVKFAANPENKVLLKNILTSNVILNGVDLGVTIEQMQLHALNLLKTTNDFLTCTIHGDFHAPNIARHKDKITLIDFSDIAKSEDPCWDLSKWLNFINHFYKVTAVRQAQHFDTNLSVTFPSSKDLEIERRFPNSLSTQQSLEKINQFAVSDFSRVFNLDNKEVTTKLLVGQFIVNISTFLRHLRHFPHTTPNVIEAVVSSYLPTKDL